MKNRLVRVRELLQRELGAIIARDHAFPGVLVTVNDVDITPDLKHAHVYIGVIGPGHKAERVVDVLNHQHGDLQTRVFKRVVLKYTPRFHFRLDHSVERGVQVTRIMNTIDEQLAASAARDAAAGILPAPPDDEAEALPKIPVIAKPEDPGDEDEEAAAVPASDPRPRGPRRHPRDFRQQDDED